MHGKMLKPAQTPDAFPLHYIQWKCSLALVINR